MTHKPDDKIEYDVRKLDPKLPDVDQTRKNAAITAATLGEKEYEYLQAMRLGQDEFASQQLAEVSEMIDTSMVATLIEGRVFFELVENFSPSSPMAPTRPLPPSGSCRVTVHDKIFLTDPDNLKMFDDRLDMIAYYNALGTFIVEQALEARYLVTARSVNQGMPMGRPAPQGLQQHQYKFTSGDDLNNDEDFREKYPLPNIRFGGDSEMFISWGDADFYKALQHIDSNAHLEAIEQGLSVNDLVVID